MIEGAIIGFVFPVYFSRIPVIVEKFLDRAEIRGAPYIFAVVNGGGLFGRTLRNFSDRLYPKGKKLETLAGIIGRKLPYTHELNRGFFGFLLAFLLGFNIPYDYSTQGKLDRYFWLNER